MAPKASIGKSIKKESSAAKKKNQDKKARKKTRKQSFAIYLYKVLKQVHPDVGVSSKAMSIMNSLVFDVFERIAQESSRLAAYSKKSTITSRDPDGRQTSHARRAGQTRHERRHQSRRQERIVSSRQQQPIVERPAELSGTAAASAASSSPLVSLGERQLQQQLAEPKHWRRPDDDLLLAAQEHRPAAAGGDAGAEVAQASPAAQRRPPPGGGLHGQGQGCRGEHGQPRHQAVAQAQAQAGPQQGPADTRGGRAELDAGPRPQRAQALELSPKDKNALIARSRCHLLLGEPQKALADAELALRGRSRDPRNAKALYSKAEALYYLGDFELSLVYFYRGMKIRPEFDQFRLGVQKAKEAIQNILGGNPVPMPETPGPVAAAGTGEQQRETTTTTSSTSQSSTRADSKGETSRSSCGRTSAGGTAQAAPPSAGTTTQLTGPQQHQQQQQRRSSSKRSSANVSNGNNLLGHLTRDKKYLQELIKRPDIKAAHQSSAQNIIAHAEEGLHFLKTRQEFWKQQCNARQQSSSSSRRLAATST
ncbi:unnamed protein product [Trichogramma brassicae]|uniref:Outer dynein arm-docking complex subunit 4 n=1 Tax=Trichogramma brassicae TaxID=86971 RepID=A0A6H5IL27_9HYME|nr:unnamed protein product [Trichogramma brassicae]